MTPVVVLSDAFVANGAEPWRIPDVASLEPIEVTHPGAGRRAAGPSSLPPSRKRGESGGRRFPRGDELPALRPATNGLARPWALPGTPGLMHRVGSLEKQDGTGNVSYDRTTTSTW